MNTMASLHLRLLVALLAALVVSGCCRRSKVTESFEWPEDVECPPAGEAVFYIEGYKGPGQCGGHLVSVDGPGERTEDGCEYSVTVESCQCMNGL